MSSAISLADTHKIEIDGRMVTVIEDNPYAKENVEIRRKRTPDDENRGRHTFKRYGTGIVSYYASLLTTEAAYCNNYYFPAIANNDETPTCRTEISAMLLDPGMFMGVLAMNATAIEIYKRANRPLSKFLITLSRRFGGSGRSAQALSQTMISHLSMGAGIVMQTSVAASWNAPQMKKCTADIWSRIKTRMTASGIEDVNALYKASEGEKLVSDSIDDAHTEEGSPCSEALKHFMNTEDGTLSEVRVAALTMGATIAISTTVVSSIRFAGMALFGLNPVSFAFANGIMITHFLLENVETWLERVVRAWDNSRRSKKFLGSSFIDLMEAVDNVGSGENNVNKYVGHYLSTECTNYISPTGPGASNKPRAYGCQQYSRIDNYGFGVKEALTDYKYNLEYRKRGASNRFIETQTRWKEKVADVYTAVTTFQKTMKLMFQIREQNKTFVEEDSELFYNSFSLLTRVDAPINIPTAEIPNLRGGGRAFSTEQLNAIYSDVIRPLMEKCKEASYLNRNANLQKVLMALHNAFHDNYNLNDIRINLWRLKALFDDQFIAKYHGLAVSLTDDYNGHRFTEEEVLKVRTALTNMVTTLTPKTAAAHLQFEAEGIQLLESIVDEEEGGEDEGSQSSNGTRAARKGLPAAEVSSSATLLKMNKDDDFPFLINETSFWTDRENEGFDSNKLSSKILSHLVCGEAPNGIEFFWVSGKSDRMVLPNALKDPERVNCDYRSELMPRFGDVIIPSEDFIYVPENNTVKRYQTEEVIHRIFTYNGKETIGLFDIMTNPQVLLKWKNFEAFDADWKTNMQPKFLEYALKVRKEYYESVDSYLDLFADDKTCHTREGSQECGSFAGDNLKNLISEDEIQNRTSSRMSSRSFYSNIYTGDTIVEEFRTYAYVLGKLFPQNRLFNAAHFYSIQLKQLVPKVYETVKLLDTQNRDFQFDVETLSKADIQAKIQTLPFPEILGEESLVGFSEGFAEIKAAITGSLATLEAGAAFEDAAGDALEGLTNEQAEMYTVYKIYKNLDDSLNGLDNVILREYIGGSSITYMDNE